MKKDIALKFAVFSALSADVIKRDSDPAYVAPDSDLDRVLKEIFSVDSDTGVIRGDIAYFMSGNGNPQIKQWIENNLFTSMRNNGGYDPKVTNDDLIAEFSRRSDESVSAYSQRLLQYYADAKALESKDNKTE